MRKLKIEAWATADEISEITRNARALKMSRSEYLRMCALSRFAQTTQQHFDESALSSIRAELAEVRESHAAAARAFEVLLQQLRELTRVPSFREFRARAYVDGILEKNGESAFDYLLRIAQLYYAQYRSWPDPRDSKTFGPTPADFPRDRWPRR